jgi:nitronate monooxygenase
MAESGVWPDRRVTDLLEIELPILQAPMAGAQGSDLAIAVSEAGGLGALPCAMLSPEQIRKEVAAIRAATSRPVALNFFCHRSPEPEAEREAAWRARLKPYYDELGIDQNAIPAGASRRPFDAAACDVVEEMRPSVVSFHFGLPDEGLLERVRSTGAKILASATTVAEARWLDARGCDLVIAQGAEAGGHRGTFLVADVATQVGTMALVPQVVDAVSVPVVAAGGIADGRGIAAAFALGASAVLIGTAYLRCPEARISDVHRRALEEVSDDGTAITNVFSGRPARGIVNRLVREVGPMSEVAPEFPLAGMAIAPLRSATEAKGSPDFAQMWAGQAASLGRAMPAGELTRRLADETHDRLRFLT